MGYVGRRSSGQVLTDNSSGNLPYFQDLSFSKSAFLVLLNSNISNVLGNSASPYPVLFDNIIFDNTSNVTLNSGGKTIFTAPSDGVYNFSFCGRFTSVPGSGTIDAYSFIIAGSTTYSTPMGNLVKMANVTRDFGWTNSIIVNLTASTVVYVAESANGSGSSNIGIQGGCTYFSGNYLT